MTKSTDDMRIASHTIQPERVPVVLCFAGPVATKWQLSVMEELARAELELKDLDSTSETAVGIVAFSHFGKELCESLRTLSMGGHRRMLAVVQTSEAIDASATWQLLEAGAADVVAWDRTLTPAMGIAERLRRWHDIDRVISSPMVREVLVGESLTWRSVLRQIVEIAAFSDVAVLIGGESGTGKELVARLIHALDPRPGKAQLVLVDCTTVVPTLSGSEFFGHEKGAFTGAISARDGAFADADGGTLFLDEVGELPYDLQAELLRVVQEGTYKRVGSNTWRRAKFRLICATNRDLAIEESEGRFRRDLYYRIAACTCQLPSLRERQDDILPLVRHFLAELLPNGNTLELDPPVAEFLSTKRYPGNVRELRHLVAQIARRHVGDGPVTVGDIPHQQRPQASTAVVWPDPALASSIRRALARGVSLKEISTAARNMAIAIAVEDSDGNLKRAARVLGVTDRALQLRRAAGLRELNAVSGFTR
jgi:transcriptional regulator with GAF, ATPase, and Fis domain